MCEGVTLCHYACVCVWYIVEIVCMWASTCVCKRERGECVCVCIVLSEKDRESSRARARASGSRQALATARRGVGERVREIERVLTLINNTEPTRLLSASRMPGNRL